MELSPGKIKTKIYELCLGEGSVGKNTKAVIHIGDRHMPLHYLSQLARSRIAVVAAIPLWNTQSQESMPKLGALQTSSSSPP